ncbi:MAG: recombinase family protein [Clostridia bacterium]|nr:recombinase family protein [Clostridia bacterium]
MVAIKNSYRVGIYTRLSIDDGTNEESVSIDTQKKILTEFVTNKGWQIAKIYVDDGYSGGNFDRPDFKRMIQDIENKEIDCVVTKDLSRLGRNYIDCGFYLEIYFPEHQVRYIAVNDGVDTISNSSMDITPFKNILNEMYVKDISVKVSSARRARLHDGKYMTTVAPYGYLKDENDNTHLVVDPETAPIVKQIYEMYYNGKGTNYIGNYLEKNKIISPMEYFYQKGFIKKRRKINKNMYNWNTKKNSNYFI